MALSTNDVAAVCLLVGVEYAYPLFSMMHTKGSRCTAAKFRPSWNAPVEVAPSPMYTSTTRASRFILKLSATPAITGIMSPRCEIWPMKPRSRSPKWMFSSRPRVGESPVAMYWRMTSTGVAPFTSMEPRLRMSGESTSCRSSANALPTASASWPNERKSPPTNFDCRYSATSRSSSVRVKRIQR